MMRYIKTVVLVMCSMAALSGCATKIQSMKSEAQVNLGANEGYLLLNVATTLNLSKIRIEGRKHFELTKEDLQAGNNYILIPIGVGDYHFSRIVFETYKGIGFVDLEKGLWDFTVRPGAIGYVGHMEVESSFWGARAKYVMINRSTKALEFLEKHFPTIVQTKGVQYRGMGKDHFFEVVGVDKPHHKVSNIKANEDE